MCCYDQGRAQDMNSNQSHASDDGSVAVEDLGTVAIQGNPDLLSLISAECIPPGNACTMFSPGYGEPSDLCCDGDCTLGKRCPTPPDQECAKQKQSCTGGRQCCESDPDVGELFCMEHTEWQSHTHVYIGSWCCGKIDGAPDVKCWPGACQSEGG